MDWKLSRLTVCWCSSSMAARPNSLAGSITVAAAKRTGAACCSRCEQQRERNDGGVCRHHCRREQIDGRRFCAQPRSADHDAGFLVEAAGEIEHRGSGAQGLLPVPAREVFAAAEKCEVSVVERIGADGLDEGDFVAHLVQLALRVLLRRGAKSWRRPGAIRKGLPSTRGPAGSKRRQWQSCTQASLEKAVASWQVSRAHESGLMTTRSIYSENLGPSGSGCRGAGWHRAAFCGAASTSHKPRAPKSPRTCRPVRPET